MSGSKEQTIVATFASYQEAFKYYLDNEDTVYGEPNKSNKVNTVVECRYCGIHFWGNHTSCYCPDCKAKAKRESYEKYKENQKKIRVAEQAKFKQVKLDRIKWDEMPNTRIIMSAMEESEAVRERKEAINEWNEQHCCPLFEGSKDSVYCFYCQRGLTYAGDSTSLSNRRCPKNPIAQDGSRYIQRAAYRKNPDGTVKPGSCRRYDVLDNMPQHLKIELVERMRKMGRTLYMWSNGHVDTTPDPDSNN